MNYLIYKIFKSRDKKVNFFKTDQFRREREKKAFYSFNLRASLYILTIFNLRFILIFIYIHL